MECDSYVTVLEVQAYALELIKVPSCVKILISWQMSHLDQPEFLDEVICKAAFSMEDIGR